MFIVNNHKSNKTEAVRSATELRLLINNITGNSYYGDEVYEWALTPICTQYVHEDFTVALVEKEV